MITITNQNKFSTNTSLQNEIDIVNKEKNITNVVAYEIDNANNKKVISARNTSVVAEKAYAREHIGGKGATLYRMQQAGMQVPEFTTIDVNTINELEHISLDIYTLKPFIDDIENLNLQEVNIASIKQAIQDLRTKKLDEGNIYLQGLANFITSDAFYNKITNSQAATTIRASYNKLIASLPEDSAIIVRSSGIKEDNYGDAQAGKFESIVHGQQDILHTCLQVLQSSFQPHVCQFSAPKPIALIFQRCINCSFGGVAMSRASQKDSRCKIEFAFGQPKGAVSGLAGVTPHCYLTSQEDNEFVTEFIAGNVTTEFVLNQQDVNNFIEQAVTVNSTNINLNDKQLKQIHQYLQQGEDMLLCPADIEFAIDKNGTVYIVQLRPLTVLTGGVNFATEPPANPLAVGTLVSEGFCSGNLYYVKNSKDAKTIPLGALVVAEHGEDWMLENSFLKKVSGFIFAEGGTNDHLAITLRQQEKPCLIVKDTFAELKNSNAVVTLACCSFNDNVGAYIVNGSELANKLATMHSEVKASYQPGSSSTPITTTPELSFDRPDIAYKNLHDLNYILLDYFNADSWLTRCFSEKNMLLLSMAPHRIEIIKEAGQEIDQFFADFELFITGYKQFLQIGITSRNNNAELQQKLAEAEKLNDKFKHIKTQVNNNLANISQQFTALANQTINKGDFKQLLQDAQCIFTDIQKFNIPKSISDVKSIHDCIFWIHKGFIDALIPVIINSGLGTITTHGNVISIVFYNKKEQQKMQESCIDALNKLSVNAPSIIVIMENAIIATVQLGTHACTIEMLEQADAGKERTLKLKLSDNFTEGYNYQGKLKRFWFFTQMLYNSDFSGDADAMKVSVNEDTGILTVEVSHIKTKKEILDKFLLLIKVLDTLKDLDMHINKANFNIKESDWNFSILKQKITNLYSIENQQYFNHLVIILGCLGVFDNFAYTGINTLYPLFELIKKLRPGYTQAPIDIQNLLDNIEIINQENLLFDLLAVDITSIISFVKVKYPDWLTNKEIFIKLVSFNGMLLEYASDDLCDDQDVVLAAANQDIMSLEYASIKITNNVEFMAKCINNININAFIYAGKKIKNDKIIVQLIIEKDIFLLAYAGIDVKKNEDIMLLAIQHNYISFQYASDDLQQKKNFILKAIKVNPEVYHIISKSFQNDASISEAYKKASEKQFH